MKKKILFVDQNSSLGGGQRVLLDLIQFSAELGHHPFLMLPSEGYVAETAKSLNIPFGLFPMPQMSAGRKKFSEKISYPFYALKCASKIEEFALYSGIDLIFANGPRVFLPCAIAGKRIGKPVHLQLHLLFEKGAEKKLIEALLKSDAVKSAVACSNKVFEPFKEIVPPKMKVVPYWVSPPFLNEIGRREELRDRYGIFKESVAIGVIGRISPTKGQVFCLDALIPLLEENKNIV
ncbi:MAG: glycosyltransferase, partial [Acidobacteria bacterium]|nr:glycosyltransferase [Acidobacteriota bacterium]